MKKRSARKRIELLAIYSDLHCGSTQAIIPPGFVTSEGYEVGQNRLQKWLWDRWLAQQQFLEAIVGDSDYGIVINGDVIEGNHHGTKQIWSPKVDDHFACAVQVLRPVTEKAVRRFIVKGTECHVGEMEGGIGNALGFDKCPETKLPVFDRLTLEVNGCRVVFRHHIGTSTRRALGATQLGVQLNEEVVEAAANGEPVPKVLCCAHRHVFGAYRDNHGLCVVTPPWQSLTRFGHKVVPAARTKPGVVILDWRGLPPNSVPRVHAEIYDTPPPASISL